MKGLPKRCYVKHGAVYYVDMSRKWHRLCSEREGLPTAYRALAKLTDKTDSPGMMAAVTTAWLDENRKNWADNTRRDREAIGALIAKGFAEFHCSDVKTPDVVQFLKKWADKPRYHNVVRGILSQILRYAAQHGHREGFNPVDNIKGKSVEARKRIVTDADLKAMRGSLAAADYPDGMLAVFDIAILTGLRIGDIIKLRWQDVKDDGLHIVQQKTGTPQIIEWSPDLKAAVNRCATKPNRIGHVIKTRDGSPYTYWGVKSAWDRGLKRAGLEDFHIHDLRGRAGVDKVLSHGKEAAQGLLGHSRLAMTEHYTEGKTVKKTRANNLPKPLKVRQNSKS
jgi:integrase